MSHIVECDACGESVERETFAFEMENEVRKPGGDFIDPEGWEQEWDHQELYGDLCSECARPVIEVLNKVLDSYG